MYKTLIIGFFDNYEYDQLKYWINSINMSGFKGDKILVGYNFSLETAEKIRKAGFEPFTYAKFKNDNRILFPMKLPVHVMRFNHLALFLKQHPGYDYVITTDVKDVIFQKDPTEYLKKHISPIEFRKGSWNERSFVVASENIQYKNEPWGKQNIIDAYGNAALSMMDNEIFNVGILAGTQYMIEHIADYIFQESLCINYPIVDQACYNRLIHETVIEQEKNSQHQEFRIGSIDDGWCVNAGTTNDPKKDFSQHMMFKNKAKMVGDLIKNDEGETLTIVHQWDRNEDWSNMIKKKYG